MSEEDRKSGLDRRTFCLGAGGAIALLALGGLNVVPAQAQVRPPGGQDQEKLLSACIRCQKCYEVCPESVIAPAHIEDGIVGVRTPIMDFSHGWCDYCAEANAGMPRCVEACPTEALHLPESATAQNTVLGKAVIYPDLCLAYKLIGCRFCYDACPYEAIELDSEGRPFLHENLCNGCGACESVCVSLQNGSITAGARHRAIMVRPEGYPATERGLA